MNEIAITVNIADRPYHLHIDRQHEEVVKRAEKAINVLVNDYSVRYAYQDKQDLLAMVSLSLTTNTLNADEKLSSADPSLIRKLEVIDKILDDAF